MNDIINIVRRILSGKKVKECNREYYKLFKVTGNHKINVYSVWLMYKFNNQYISYRFVTGHYIRKQIVCFLTNQPTGYHIPKNY